MDRGTWPWRISVRGWSGRLPWCDPRMDPDTWPC